MIIWLDIRILYFMFSFFCIDPFTCFASSLVSFKLDKFGLQLNLLIMSKKQESIQAPQNGSQQQKAPLASGLVGPLFANKQNHLSSTYENLLIYEQISIELEQITNSTSVPKEAISKQMKEPLIPSSLKGEQIFQKYGAMIQNQPQFLKGIIFHNYLPYLPQKFQNEFSQIMLTGTCFEFVWWSSLVVALIQAYRHRRADYTLKEKGGKVLGFAFLFMASSIGFYDSYYTPKLQKCYYKNIKSIDSLMDRHVKILKACGAQLEENVPIQTNQTQKLQNDSSKSAKSPQIIPTPQESQKKPTSPQNK